MIRKRGLRSAALCVLCTVLLSEPLLAATTSILGGTRLRDYDIPGLEQVVSIHSLERPMTVHELIVFATLKGNLNIVTTSGVRGNVKLSLQKVTLGELLEIAFASVTEPPLAYEVEGNVIKVMTEDEYRAENGADFNNKKVMTIIDLKFADASHVAQMLDGVKSPQGSIVADEKTRTLILIDTPQKIREMEAVIARAEIPDVVRVNPTEMRSFTLQYASVLDLLDDVEQALTPEIGNVRADERSKTFIVEDVPERLARIEAMLTKFDVPQKQVFIEAKVVEVTLGDSHQLGVNWGHIFDKLDPRYQIQALSTPGLPGAGLASGTLQYNAVLGNGELSMILQALREVGDTKSLSNPQIMVTDGEKAEIKVVEDQPYKERQFESGSTNVIAETIKFVEVGVILTVVPQINDLGYITVKVSPEISSITQWFDGEPQFGTPVVQKTLADTEVTVRDGVTIIIAGLIRDRNEKTISSVPLLGSIPLLGHLFRHTSTAKVNTETIIFLTPRIVSGSQPVRRMHDLKKAPKPRRDVRSTGTARAPRQP